MKVTKLITALLLIGATALVTSCKKDTPTNKEKGGKGDLVLCAMFPNPDGMSGTCWLQMVDGIAPKAVDNAKAYQIGYGTPPHVHGRDIFCFPDYGNSNTLVRYTWTAEHKLEKTGELSFPTNSFSTHAGFYSESKAYFSTITGKLIVVNPKEMKIIKELDFSKYAAEGAVVPQFGLPHFSEGKMYLPLWQVDANRRPLGEPLFDMLIIDVATDEVLHHIREKANDLYGGGYPYGETLFTDEKGDVYITCGGSFGSNPKYKTGIVRIKKGETKLDPTFNWVFDTQVIEGEPNKVTWLESAHYAGNGKMYATADVSAYWKDPKVPNFLRDRSVIALEIDLYAKTVKKLPIPHSCSYAMNVSSYNDLILFAVFGDKDAGIYSYNPGTGKASEKPVIATTGYPFWFYQMK